MIYAATTERSIAMVLLAVVVVGWAIYVFVNIRRSKSEVGSEIELAANRGSLPDDEVLEGSRLEQVQAFGVLMLLIIALVLPIYWLREGGRRAGAEQGFGERAAAAGERGSWFGRSEMGANAQVRHTEGGGSAPRYRSCEGAAEHLAT